MMTDFRSVPKLRPVREEAKFCPHLAVTVLIPWLLIREEETALEEALRRGGYPFFRDTPNASLTPDLTAAAVAALSEPLRKAAWQTLSHIRMSHWLEGISHAGVELTWLFSDEASAKAFRTSSNFVRPTDEWYTGETSAFIRPIFGSKACIRLIS